MSQEVQNITKFGTTFDKLCNYFDRDRRPFENY